MDGKAIAWYYVTRGQFLVDTLTAIAWIAQVHHPREHSDKGQEMGNAGHTQSVQEVQVVMSSC